MQEGVLVVTEVSGLSQSDDACMNPVFGYHIHSGEFCTGDSEDPFADAKAHYNPDNCEHPYHAGDMPPIFGNNGYAFSITRSRQAILELKLHVGRLDEITKRVKYKMEYKMRTDILDSLQEEVWNRCQMPYHILIMCPVCCIWHMVRKK